ncbi:MAG: TolC family protein [Candidatus Margulisbacteria bacterium]|nr:TolC family protein [Candidatus Margulisiibacteriota bacterium]
MNKKVLIPLIISVAFSYQVDKGLESYLNYTNPNPNNSNEIIIDHSNKLNVTNSLKEALKDNALVKAAILQYLMSDSDEQKYQTNYSPFVRFDSGYTHSLIPNGGLSAFTGTDIVEFSNVVSYGKKFNTGTTMALGMGNTYSDANDSALPPFKVSADPAKQKPIVFVQFQQALLKNNFGINDKNLEEILANQTETKKALAKYDVSRLFAKALFDYWDLIEKYRNICDTTIQFNEYKKINQAVAKNIELGTLESYYSNQFNALIYGTQSTLKLDSFAYNSSARNLLQTLSLPIGEKTKLKFIYLNETKPVLNVAKLLETAYANRADYLQVNLALESASKNIAILKNELMPEAKLSYQLTGLGDDESFSKAFGDAASLKYSNQEVKFAITMLLDDKNTKIKLRDAMIQYEQVKLQKELLTRQIQIEVLNATEQIDSLYQSLVNAKKANEEAQIYYSETIKKLEQGRINILSIKDAIDMMINTRKGYTKVLLGYNLSLIQLDLVTNTIFDTYKVDTNAYINSFMEENK